MSKFLEMLDRTLEAKSVPLGFGAANKASRAAAMVVVARLPRLDAALMAQAVQAGADVLLLDVADPQQEDEALGQVSAVAGEVPWGIGTQALNKAQVDRLADMDCDFVVFGAGSTTASVLAEEDLGRMLFVEASLADGPTRAISYLDVDGVVVVGGDGDSPLTVQQLITYARLAAYTGKYVIAPLPLDCSPEDLEMLCEAGTRAIVVEMAGPEAADQLASAKEYVKELSPRKRKSRERATALLPSAGGVSEEEWEEEDEF